MPKGKKSTRKEQENPKDRGRLQSKKKAEL